MCGRSVWFHYFSSTFLTVHGELSHIILSSLHMFTPLDRLAWVNVGGGCYRGRGGQVRERAILVFGEGRGGGERENREGDTEVAG